tara:strand:- start:4203 stop:4769 length:567 start_codon:yes stop_codon:yes gene_type:complete
MIKERVKSEYIIRKICDYFNLEESLVFSKWRKKELVKARHYIIYYMYYYGETVGSPSAIRDVFKKRGGITNHASVIYAVKRIEDDLSYSIDANRTILEIDAFVGVVKRNYLTIHYFMDVNKGHVMNISTEKNDILWKHESIQKRGNTLYLTGEYKHPEHGWLKSDNKLYEYGGYLCMGDDAERAYENK